MAQELVSGNFEFGIRRNYWVRDKEGASSQVDLAYQFGNKVIPVEVKSGTNSRLRLLHQFIDRAPHDIAVRVWTGRYSVDNVKTLAGKPFRLVNLPFYYVGQLDRILSRIM